MTTKMIPISKLKANPNNPRIIKDDKFAKLVKSLQEFPEMLEARPIVVNPDMVVLGGNMRLKACKEAGIKEAPVYVATWEEAQQRQFIIKDNVGFGEWDWDLLANEWDAEQLEEWGLDVPDITKVDEMAEGETLYLDKSLQILPKKEYIIIMADEGSEEWEELKRIFSCKIVRQGGCRVGSKSDKATTGLERVFDLGEFKSRVLNELRSSYTK